MACLALTLLNRIEFAVFAVAYFFPKVLLLLGLAGACRRWWEMAPRLAAKANTMTQVE
jgi:hypothetical protein